MPNNLIVNPNFDGNSLVGWTAVPANGNRVAAYKDQAAFGTANSAAGGQLSQEVSVTPGEKYFFSFDYGLANAGTATGVATGNVTIVTVPGGAELVNSNFADDTEVLYTTPAADKSFNKIEIEIPAGVTAIKITFTDLTSSTNGLDLVLDNIDFRAVCFTRGTLIETDAGERPVETLRKGDLVRTLHGGLQPIRWIGHRRLTSAELAKQPKLRPILICKDALGSGVPATDLIVSPQHRMLVSSTIVHRVFGENVVLVSAKQLLPLDGVSVVEDDHPVEYWHFLCDDHQIVTANGAMAETLLLGQEALKTLSGDALDEIRTIFPELDLQDTAIPAATIARGPRCRQMVARHLKNRKALVQHLSLPGDNVNAPVAAKTKERA